MTRPTFIDLNPNEYNQGMRYCPFMVNLDLMEVVILLMVHLIEYKFKIQDVNTRCKFKCF